MSSVKLEKTSIKKLQNVRLNMGVSKDVIKLLEKERRGGLPEGLL